MADQWKSRGANQVREPDAVTVENPEVGAFDVFNALRISHDLTKPSEASFSVGDDATYNELANAAIRMGSPYRVWVNDRLQLTGRVEMIQAPMSASDGTPMEFIVRTKLADAMYASANSLLRVTKGSSIKQFLLGLYYPLGYSESDFVFNADVSRNILTGKNDKGLEPDIALEEIKEENLKISPPESIYEAADRILKRHGLMHWDSPDGKIVVGAPNDEQSPLFRFFAYNDRRSSANNVLHVNRSRDASQAPAVLMVAGSGAKTDWTQNKVSSVQTTELAFITDKDGRNSFYRPVVVVAEALKNDKLAERQAKREITNRSKALDAWEVEVDGLTYWDGSSRIPYAVDTVATIDSSNIGGPSGSYLVIAVNRTVTCEESDKTTLSLLKKGLWRL